MIAEAIDMLDLHPVMNERIKELAEQAYGIDDGKPFHPSALVALEKFAELIVKECAAIASMNQHQWEPTGVYVLKHFGVEE